MKKLRTAVTVVALALGLGVPAAMLAQGSSPSSHISSLRIYPPTPPPPALTTYTPAADADNDIACLIAGAVLGQQLG